MLFNGGGDFLAVEVDSDLLTATAVILSSHCYVFLLDKGKNVYYTIVINEKKWSEVKHETTYCIGYTRRY